MHQETQKILSSGSKLGSSKNQDKMCLHWKGINEKITNINKITFCLSQGKSLFFFPPTQIVFNNYSSIPHDGARISESIAHEAEGRMGY